jgi:hypothetical protein
VAFLWVRVVVTVGGVVAVRMVVVAVRMVLAARMVVVAVRVVMVVRLVVVAARMVLVAARMVVAMRMVVVAVRMMVVALRVVVVAVRVVVVVVRMVVAAVRMLVVVVRVVVVGMEQSTRSGFIAVLKLLAMMLVCWIVSYEPLPTSDAISPSHCSLFAAHRSAASDLQTLPQVANRKVHCSSGHACLSLNSMNRNPNCDSSLPLFITERGVYYKEWSVLGNLSVMT